MEPGRGSDYAVAGNKDEEEEEDEQRQQESRK